MVVREIRVRARAEAPLAMVWSVLTDQVGMSDWVPMATVTLEREGDPPPDGVGAIRVFKLPMLKVREQITRIDEPARLTYRMLSGLPARDYVGTTHLSEDDDGTRVDWSVTLTSRFPGTALAVRVGIRLLAKGLVKVSERRAAELR